MVAAICFALVASQPVLPGACVAKLPEQVVGLGWTQGGRLIAVTNRTAHDLSSGRKRKLHGIFEQFFEEFLSQWAFGDGSTLDVSPNGRRAIGNGYVLDLRTLRSTPLKRSAIWIGNDLAEIDEAPTGWSFVRGKKRTIIARGWIVIGVSPNGRYAMACKQEPFDDVTTYLLRIDPTTGRATQLAEYPKSSFDHVFLSEIDRQPGGSRFLAHKIDVASGIPEPYWADRTLVPIEIGKGSDKELWMSLSWLDHDWLIADRHFMHEDSKQGMDGDAFELWRPRDGRLVRLVRLDQHWPADDPKNLRAKQPVLSAFAVDWPRRKFAYTVNRPGRGEVYVMSIPRLDR